MQEIIMKTTVTSKVVTALIVLVGLSMSTMALEINVQFGDNITNNNWNVVSPNTKNIAELFDADANITTISLTVLDSFAGVNRVGPDKTDKELGLPAKVSADSLFGDNNNNKAVIEIKGLNKDKKYKFAFFASRMKVKDKRETVFEVSGLSTGNVTLDTANNTSKVAEIESQPTDSGRIVITITKGKNNDTSKGYFYLGAMKITEVK